MTDRQPDLRLDSKWTTGQRTPLWDALWHRILADVAPSGRDEPPTEQILGQDGRK